MTVPCRRAHPRPLALASAASITAGYDAGPVLHDVSWTLAGGEVRVVVGGDGAGKTTLLRVLAGVLEPRSGCVTRPDPRAIGFVPAGPGCYLDLTVDENLAFTAAAYGIRRSLAARSEPLLEATGLGGARDRLAGRLSGGMRRKLAFLLALLHDPELLVLDEPTTGVDPVSRVELWRLVARAAADGRAVAVATTYLDEAERAAEVLVLHEGRTLLEGTPDHVIGAIAGHVVETQSPRDPSRAWRRGATWREWLDGEPDPGGRVVEADLEDAVIVAALHQERAR